MTSTYTIRTEGTRLIVSEDGVDASPAAALELAERLQEAATPLLPKAPRVTPEERAAFLHATYDDDERGLWEDSHP